MPNAATVLIHPTQFPDSVRRDLLESLRSREVNHKFHYDSWKQTQKWLALHQAQSPSRNDPDCAATYDRAFNAAAERLRAPHAVLIGLGCGGGQKDARLLDLMNQAGTETSYAPCDVSTAMVLTARQTAAQIVPDARCLPLVCDLTTAEDLPAVLETLAPATAVRLITFFGMIPNFEPQRILPKLAAMLRPDDWLLFSANLAPGPDYAAGVRHVLPQYDNPLTREWLMTFLLDAGVDRADGEMKFEIEDDPAAPGLKRIVATFIFGRPCRIRLEDESFAFAAGTALRLFYSYRYTPALARSYLRTHRLQVVDQWLTGSQEEGVFLCRKD